MATARPRLLDLFCGAGGCAEGYRRAGFDVVMGVDIAPQPHYPFPFTQRDALAFLNEILLTAPVHFDAIHASPPCQAYTTMNNRHGSSSPPLIAEVRSMLVTTGLPYVIENVAGALAHMRSPVVLTGEMFGLGVHRPRLFESNVAFLVPQAPPCQTNPVAVYGKQDGRRLWTRADGSELRVGTLKAAREAMDIDWMDWDEIREAVPPAYTHHIGAQLIDAVREAA